MTTTINASNSGGGGLVQTADASGVLALQTAGVTAVTVDASQNVTLAGTLTSTGVTTVQAGTAADPAITTTGDTNTGIFFPAADTIAFSEGGAEAMRIDSSGNVGIGTASPSAKLELGSGTLLLSNNVFIQQKDSSGNAKNVAGVNSSNQYNFGGIDGSSTINTIRALVAGNEAMRIDSTGEVLIGATAATQTADGLFVKGKRTATSNQWNFQVYTNAGQSTLSCRDDYYLRSVAVYDRTSGSGANVFIDSSGYLYRSTSSLKYKRDVVDYDKGISTVMQLRPVYYKSKVNDPDGNLVNTQYAGLIAEELDALGLDEFVVKDNTGEVESIHYGNMVALLTKAIQEQQALITSLTARIAALEGTPA
jgi:hypothetical protein